MTMSAEPLPVAFHNVAELEESTGGLQGRFLRRFPRSVRFDPELSRIGRHFTAHTSNGCEIRFVAPHPVARVYLSSTYTEARVFVLRGEYPWKEGYIPIEGGRVNTLHLEHEGHAAVERGAFAQDRFPPELWRIYCLDAPILFCGVEAGDGRLRAPTPAEQPRRRWLAYGSSITQAGTLYVNYVNTTAQLLGVDALNLGMGGSCHIERSVADSIAARDDWDFATFELGVNMRDQYTEAEFEQRARYLVETVTAAHPRKPVILLTVFRNGLDYTREPERPAAKRNHAFRDILRDIAAGRRGGNVHVLDGLELFPDLVGFQSDLVHPMPLAFVRAGIRLADRLRPLVGGA